MIQILNELDPVLKLMLLLIILLVARKFDPSLVDHGTINGLTVAIIAITQQRERQFALPQVNPAGFIKGTKVEEKVGAIQFIRSTLKRFWRL